MKKFYYLFCFLLLAFSVFAQEEKPRFYEFGGKGILYKSDTDTVRGVMYFSYMKNSTVILATTKEEKYKAAEIKGFIFEDGREFLSGRNAMGVPTFVQVITPENKKIKLVETFTPIVGEVIERGREPEGEWDTSIFIVDKGENYQGFKKIAQALKDSCPQLSAKISKKEKGYYVGLISLEEDLLKAYHNIMNEVEAGCK